MKLLIFGGTTEGRLLARRLAEAGAQVTVSVATPMGAEELEESEFEPMFSACEQKLTGRPTALFGSYGWGDGEWMRLWEDRCAKAGIPLACGSVICCEAPDDAGCAACRRLGEGLV